MKRILGFAQIFDNFMSLKEQTIAFTGMQLLDFFASCTNSALIGQEIGKPT